jgi:hypothetical protein
MQGAIAFDTLSYAKQLISAGFTEKQAEQESRISIYKKPPTIQQVAFCQLINLFQFF